MLTLMPTRIEQMQLALLGARHGHPLLVGGDSANPMLVGVTDDRGIYAYVTLLCQTFNWPIQRGADVLLIGSLLVGMTVATVSLMLLVRSWVSRSLVLLGLLALTIWSLRIGELYVMSTAAMGLFPLLLLCRQRILPWFALIATGVSIGLFLGMAQTVRSHVATSLALMAIPLFFYRPVQCLSRRVALIVPALIMFAVVTMWFNRVIDRAEAYVQSRTNVPIVTVNAHPFWHSVYLGIGFRDNPWNIRYQDECASDAVAAVDPRIVYCSPQYEAVLRDKVLDIVAEQPMFILHTLFAKLGVMMFYLLCFANLGLIAAWRYPPERAVMFAVVLGLAFNSLYGVLVYPLESYCLGFISLAAIFGIWCLGRVMDRWFQGSRPALQEAA